MHEIIKKVIETRQTVKAYSSKEISSKDWQQILNVIYWSPTSHGFEPYRVLVIDRKNKTLLEAIKPLMWNQGVVTEAAKLVFFVSLKREVFMNDTWILKRTVRAAEKVKNHRGEAALKTANDQANVIKNMHLVPDEPYDDEWAMKQTYIALGMSLMTAALLEIGSTPMEGFNRAKLEAFFLAQKLISKDERIAVAAAFGYPAGPTAYAHFGTNQRVRDDWDQKIVEI